jgi:aspartyl-tRNA(Asn)/glutamyl-tRNA(Gln) amidotransferase subunit A
MLSLARSIRSGQRSAAATVADCLDRIDRLNPQLNALREIHRDESLQAAAAIDDRIAAGQEVGPLAGVPIAMKDNIVTTLGTSTCGSRMLEGYRSPFTATAAQRLLDADAIILGRTNCDEFGMGSSTEHGAYGPVRNPWDPGRVPGGSSGGSAAAVAAGLCAAALGSDTGGSIRQPAALCGIVGLKPTFGRVSRHGLVAYGSSLDQVGPMTSTVADAATVLGLIAGFDPHDSTSADRPVPDYLADLERPVNDLRIGVPRQYMSDETDPQVLHAVRGAIEVFRDHGARITEVNLPLTDYGIATYYVIAPAEASSNLARFDGIRYGRRAAPATGEDLFDLYARSRAEGLGPEVQRRIMLGTYVLSAGYYDAYYKRAQQVRRMIRDEYDRAFKQCDALIGPTSPVPAFRLGTRQDPLSMYLCDVFTTVTNIAGICAISVPCGVVEVDGACLPVGMQIQCPAWAESIMLRIARQYEAAAPFTASPGLLATT